MNVERIRFIKLCKALVVAPGQTTWLHPHRITHSLTVRSNGSIVNGFVSRNLSTSLPTPKKVRTCPAGRNCWTTSALTSKKITFPEKQGSVWAWPPKRQIWQEEGWVGSDRREKPCLHLGSGRVWVESNWAIPQLPCMQRDILMHTLFISTYIYSPLPPPAHTHTHTVSNPCRSKQRG